MSRVLTEVGSHYPLFEAGDSKGVKVTSASLRGMAFVLFGIQSVTVRAIQLLMEYLKSALHVLLVTPQPCSLPFMLAMVSVRSTVHLVQVHGDISELKEIQQMAKAFDKEGIQVLAVCTNTVKACQEVVDKLGLTFPLLCDTEVNKKFYLTTRNILCPVDCCDNCLNSMVTCVGSG